MPDATTLRLTYMRRVVVPLVKMVGPRCALAAARWLARQYGQLDTPLRRLTQENLAKALGDREAPEQIGWLATRVLENYSSFWVEVFFLHRKLRAGSWRSFVQVDEGAFKGALAPSSRGAMIVTAYTGSFAVAACTIGLICRPLHVVIDQARHPAFKSWQRELYGHPQLRLLSREEASRKLADLLAAGQKVFIVGEHYRPHGRAIEVEYLGRTFRCYPTIGSLARWCDVPVVVVACRRIEGDFRFVLSVSDVIDPRELRDDRDATETITRRYMKALETVIRQWPEQYFWTRSWTRPTSEESVDEPA